MGVGEFFANINSKLEDKYSGLLDFLENKGLPAYRYNDWLENHGIPAMWFSIGFVIFIILLIVLLCFMVVSTPINVSASFMDSDFQTISQSVFLTLSTSDGQVFSGNVKSGDAFVIENVSLGDELLVSANLTDYKLSSPTSVVVDSKDLKLNLVFSKAIQTGSTTIRLIDKDGSTVIGNATVELYDKKGELISTVLSDDSGYINFSSVPINDEITLKIKRDGYADYESTMYLSAEMDDILLHRAEINDGETGKFKFVVTTINGETLSDATITLFDAKSEKKISEDITDADGVVLFMNIAKGTVIRYVVKKDGFVSFDSNSKGLNKTLVSDEELIQILLTPGGSKLNVVVKDNEDITLSGANVAIFTKDGLEIDSNKTDKFGLLQFDGLDVKKTKYVSVYAEGYYPITQKIDLDTTEDIEFILNDIKLTDAANVELFTVDASNKGVGNATLHFYVLQNNEYMPLYLGNAVTAASGYYINKFSSDINIKILAYADNLEGSVELGLVKGKNSVEIIMDPAGGMIRINVYDYLNNPMSGANVVAKSKTDRYVFESITNDAGYVEGYTDGYSELILDVIDAQGNMYSKVVDVQKIIDVQFTKSDAVEKPSINLIGIFNSSDEEVNSVQPGKTYWLKFKVAWPNVLGSGGIHVRVGEEYVDYDKQDFGILMAEAPNVTRYKYGLYYNPVVSKEVPKDYQVSGRPGMMNKWVEMNYDAPVGVNEIKVKLKVLDDANIANIPLEYRAWISKDSAILRDPEDATTDLQTGTVHELYSKTHSKNILVLPNEVSCTDTYCVSYVFRDDLISYDPLYPVVDYIYALDLEFVGLNTAFVNVAFSTDKQTKNIYMNNYEFDSTEFSPKDETHYDLQVNSISLNKDEHKKLRVYFTSASSGSSFIKFNITGTSALEKNFSLMVSDKKDFSITLTNNGLINVGEDIYVVLKDSQGFLSNAYITVLNSKGAISYFSKGNNSENNGLNGNYFLGTLPSGEYKLIVKSPGYITRELGFIVTRLGILETPGEVEVRIPVGSTSMRYTIDIFNRSKYDLKSLQYNILREDASNFTYTFAFLKSYILKNSKSAIVVDVSTDMTEQAYGDIELIVSGELETKEVVKTIIHVKFVSGKDYDTDCLTVLPAELVLSLPDYANAEQKIDFMVENKCLFDLTLAPELVSRDGEDKKVSFAMRSFNLDKGEKKTVTATFTNIEARNAEGLIAEMFMNLKTTYFNKQVPVTIDIWKTAGALTLILPPYIYTYSSGYTLIPMTIKNAGNLPVKNVRFMNTKDMSVIANNLDYYSSYTNGVSEYYNTISSYPQTMNAYDSRYLSELDQNPYPAISYDTSYMQQLTMKNYLEVRYPYLVYPYDNTTSSYYNITNGTGYNYADQYGYNNNNSYYANNTQLSQYNSGLSQYITYPQNYNSANHSFVFKPNVLDELKAGESIVIQVAVMPQTQKTTAVTPYSIIAKGTLDGAKSALQSNAITTIYSSGQDCFKVINVDQTKASSYDFVSTKVGDELKPKRIKVQNSCVEPVKVIGLSINNINQNPIFIENSSIIMPNTQAELYLTGKAVAETEGNPQTVFLMASTLNSQKPIFLPMIVSMHIGKSAKSISDSGEPITGRTGIYCDSKDSGKIYLPKISTGDCSNGYCDGETLTNYVLSKVDAYYESYSGKVSKLGNKNYNNPCSQSSSSCHFEELGVSNYEFTVYLMNDSISNLYVDKQLKDKKTGLKISNIYASDVDITQLGGAKILYLPAGLNKCGKYKLEIEGASQTIMGNLQTDTYSIKVKIQSYEETDECKINVVNAGVFLPSDKKTDLENAYGFKPGYIDYKDSDLKPVAEKISSKILGVNRLASEKSNSLMIEKGETTNDAPVELSVEGNDYSNVRIIAKVNKNLSLSNKTVQDQIAEAIEGYITGNFEGCFNSELSKALIVSKQKDKTGEFKITGCDSIKIYKGKPTCKFSVKTGTLTNAIDVELIVPEDVGLSGQILENGKPIENTITLKHTKSQGVMSADLVLMLEVSDVARALTFTKENKLTIKLKGAEDNSELASKDVGLMPCGTDPDTFVLSVLKARTDEKNNNFWAVTKWNESGQSKDICEVFKKNKEFKDDGKLFMLISSDCESLFSEKKFTEELTDKMKLPILGASAAATTACLGTELVGAKIGLGPMGWISSGLTCGVAVADLAGTSIYQMHRMRMDSGIESENWMDGVHGIIDTISFGLLTNDYENINAGDALREHQTIMGAPFNNAEKTGVATQDATEAISGGALIGGSTSYLVQREAVKLTQAYLTKVAEYVAKNPSEFTGLSFEEIIKKVPDSAIGSAKTAAETAAKKANLSLEKLITQSAFESSIGDITGAVTGASTSTATTTSTTTGLNPAISSEIGILKAQLNNLDSAFNKFDALFKNVGTLNVKSSGTYYAITDNATGFTTRVPKQILETAARNAGITSILNPTTLTNDIGKIINASGTSYLHEAYYAENVAKINARITTINTSLTGATKFTAIDPARPGELKNVIASVDSTQTTLKSALPTTSTTPTTTSSKSISAAEKTAAKEVGKDAVKSPLSGSRIWGVAKGLLKGSASFYAADQVYKATFNALSSAVTYDNYSIKIILDGVKSFVKYETYSMKYDKVGNNNLTLTVSGEISDGKCLSTDCNIDTKNLETSKELKEEIKFEGTDADLLNKLKSLNASTAENAKDKLDEFNKVYESISPTSDKALFLSLINTESNFRMVNNSNGKGVMQMTGIACDEIGKTTGYSNAECFGDLEKNIECGMRLYVDYYSEMDNYLANENINDEKATELFTLYAYNRGSSTAKKAINYWVDGQDVLPAMVKACKETMKDAKLCPESYSYPVKIYGDYLYLTDVTENSNSGQKSILQHMSELTKDTKTS